MLANIKGLVDRLELSQAKAMMPLFEAISNAVDAIEDCKDGFFKHSIVIRLIAAHDLAHQGGDETVTFDGFEISDDGIGFNDFNLASFKEAHTLSKVKGEPDNLAGGGVVTVEFKRPGRDDYNKDPADQIVQRFVEITEGAVKDIDGRPVNPERLRYTGYLIADLTPTLRRQVQMRYYRTADNEGYFWTLPEGNGYVEIISYDKLLRDAKRRNRVLFEKLGLHKH